MGGIELPPAPRFLDEEGGSDLAITLSPEANCVLAEEIERLRRTSFVCRFLAGRPSRGMVRDMFQVAVLENMPVIKSVRGLGKNFFHIELGNGSLAQPLAELKVLELKYDKVLLQPWCSLSLPFSWPPLRKKSRYLVTSKRRRATLETGKDPLREC